MVKILQICPGLFWGLLIHDTCNLTSTDHWHEIPSNVLLYWFTQAEEKVREWQESATALLNDWFGINSNWVELVPAALKFLSGDVLGKVYFFIYRGHFNNLTLHDMCSRNIHITRLHWENVFHCVAWLYFCGRGSPRSPCYLYLDKGLGQKVTSLHS